MSIQGPQRVARYLLMIRVPASNREKRDPKLPLRDSVREIVTCPQFNRASKLEEEEYLQDHRMEKNIKTIGSK
jgi:hypothetical protein